MIEQRSLAALMRPFARRLSMMLARGTLVMANAATKLQSLQMRLLAGEIKDGMEHFEPYGFTSHPQAGAEGIAAFFDGDRSHGVVICVADRRYRLKGLETGEVALYDDLGKSVVLKRDGSIEVTAPTLVIKAATKVRCETPVLECTGDIKDRCDTAPKTMNGMRVAYNAHTHNENDGAPAPTAAPNGLM